VTQQAVLPYTFYVGDGFTQTFWYPWRIQDVSELHAYLAGVRTTAYTTTGVGLATGGTLVFLVPPPNGQILFLHRVTPQTQLVDYVRNDPFDPEAHEFTLDKLTREVQDLSEALSRRPALLQTIANASRNLLFPSPSPLGIIGWNADASGLTLYNAPMTQMAFDPHTGEARGKSTALFTVNPGSTAPLVATALAPAGARCMAVTLRHLVGWVSTAGLTGLDLGGFGLQDGWGRDLPLTLGFTSHPGYWTRGDEPVAVDGENITLTPKGGAWGIQGQSRVTVHWKTYEPDV
jgi:hypothetical protein